MRPGKKKYNTQYKKKVDVERDSYLPRRSPREIVQCRGCGAFYCRRHWTLAAPTGFNARKCVKRVLCPACAKIRDGYPLGELSLRGLDNKARQETLRILRNEEAQARSKNPLERIMTIAQANGGWRIETTTEKLAQRLGRSLRKARGGKLAYQWGHNNKFLRVNWEARPE